MRIMALDYGSKRIGVALSDELFITAQGAQTIIRTTEPEDIEKIRSVIRDNGVSELVVGLPISMNGTHSQKTEETLAFVARISAVVQVPVKTWDERLTTVQAQRALLEADTSRYKRKGLADKLAAQFILQSYLDSRKKG